MFTAFGKRCSRPASLYDGLSRSDIIRAWDELTHLIGADEKKTEYVSTFVKKSYFLFTIMLVE